MKRFIILYDLRTKNKENYPDLYKWFDDNHAIEINKSVYLIKSDREIKDIYAELNSLTERNDDLVLNEFPRSAIAKNSNKDLWYNK
jgi:hypothetical protein